MRFLILFILCVFGSSSAKEFDIPITIDSRIKTLVYNANEIFTLNLKMNFQTIIEFSNDEAIELISVGDPYPWKLTPIDKRLFIKALQVGVRTNLTVITNKRTYLFDIKSDAVSSNDDNDVTHVVRFFYPKVPLDQSKFTLNDYLSQREGKISQDLFQSKGFLKERTGNTDFSNGGQKKIAINLNYSFAGEYNDATPIEIFDDSKDTFIRFKTNEKYKIYSVIENGKKRAVNTKKVGDFIVISGIHAKLYIKVGIYESIVYNDLKVNK